jgi:N utilization substance protein B
MSIRHEAREYALQFMFQTDFNDEPFDLAWADFWNKKKAGKKVKAFALELVEGVRENQMELDELLQARSENWNLKRMAAVDRNVMRIAVYEMLYREDIPPVVSLNEAVRMSKDYGTPDSGKFVNGLLDKILKSLDRPARTAIEE